MSKVYEVIEEDFGVLKQIAEKYLLDNMDWFPSEHPTMVLAADMYDTIVALEEDHRSEYPTYE
jgi:hypothetical protein